MLEQEFVEKGEKMLSVCIITKNEQENLTRCVETLLCYPVEVVVLDTGSTDGTLDYLSNLQKKLRKLKQTDFSERTGLVPEGSFSKGASLVTGNFLWCDDFSAARNAAVAMASNEIILSIDSDEFLYDFSIEELEKEIAQNPGKVGRICIHNQLENNTRENVEWISRVFSRKQFFYEGRIHEQITARDGEKYQTFQSCLAVLHLGYDLSEQRKKEKAVRNIRLLKKELEQTGYNFEKTPEEAVVDLHNEKIPYLLYQFGKSAYFMKDYANACDAFARGLSYDLDLRLEYVCDMVETYGYALVHAKRAGEALFLESLLQEFGNNADFFFLLGYVYMNNECFSDAIEAFLKATEYTTARTVGANSYLAYYNIGVIYECMGQFETAKSYYKKCGMYVKAREGMKRIGQIRG